MKSISYLTHLKQTTMCLQEKQVETRHRLTVKLELMDEHVGKQVGEHVVEHMGDHLGEQGEVPVAKNRPSCTMKCSTFGKKCSA